MELQQTRCPECGGENFHAHTTYTVCEMPTHRRIDSWYLEVSTHRLLERQ